MEEFATIEGFTNYHASSEGAIINIKTGHRLKPDKKGRVTLYRGGVPNKRTVARLVADAFYVSPMYTHDWVLHWDNDTTNCRVENLYRGNAIDMALGVVESGKHNHANKTHCPKGHEYDVFKTRPDGRSSRECSACRRAQQNASNQRKREVL